MQYSTIILCTIDSFRGDLLEHPSIPAIAPTIHELRQQGASFSQTHATGPFTPASFPGILFGQYPLDGDSYSPVPKQFVALAELLTHQGYQTYGVNDNPYLSRFFGYDRGFLEFEDFLRGTQRAKNPRTGIKAFARRISKTSLSPIYAVARQAYYEMLAVLGVEQHERQPAKMITDTAIRMLERGQGPAFLWAHYMQLHTPFFPSEKAKHRAGVRTSRWSDRRLNYKTYTRPKSLTGQDIVHLRELYRASLADIDDEITRLRSAVSTTGRESKSLFILTADHGEEFLEHGGRSHLGTLFQELLHVPLLIAGPGLKSGTRIDEPVSLIDLPPTILDASGMGPRHPYRGRTLLPQLRGVAGSARDIFAQVRHTPRGMPVSPLQPDDQHITRTMVRRGNQKVIHSSPSEHDEYFDLTHDPQEQHPKDPVSSAAGDELLSALQRFLKDQSRKTPSLEHAIDAVAAKLLRATSRPDD